MLHPVRIIEIERGNSCHKHMFRGEDVNAPSLINDTKLGRYFRSEKNLRRQIKIRIL